MYKNDRSVGEKDGVSISVKKRHHDEPEMENEHFSVITDSDALAIEIEMQNSLQPLFRIINALSNHVIFVGDLTENISNSDVPNQTSPVPVPF